MAYLCLGIGPTKKQQAFIYVKIHILRVHFLGTSLLYLPTSVPKAPFSAFGTEVLSPVPMQTSVLDARFRHFRRKFHALYTYRLPYQRPVFRILYGSFYPCSLADFRTKAPFSAFCTEVSCPVPLLTSIPRPRFLHFVRKFHTLFACSKRFMTGVVTFK